MAIRFPLGPKGPTQGTSVQMQCSNGASHGGHHPELVTAVTLRNRQKYDLVNLVCLYLTFLLTLSWNSKHVKLARCCTAAQLTGFRPRVCAPSDRSTILAPTTGKGDYFCATRDPARPPLLNSPRLEISTFQKGGNFKWKLPRKLSRNFQLELSRNFNAWKFPDARK